MIGQSSFTSSLFLPETSASLRGPAAIAFDSGGNLWVGDTSNDRVLEYTTPFSTDEAANVVIGQPTFTFSWFQPTPNSTGLWAPNGVAFDHSGNLWVTDRDDNRATEYTAPFSTDEAASLVIGQPNFDTRYIVVGDLTAASQYNPIGIAFDSGGNLWVADTGNNRVLEYPASPSSTTTTTITVTSPTTTTQTASTTSTATATTTTTTTSLASTTSIATSTSSATSTVRSTTTILSGVCYDPEVTVTQTSTTFSPTTETTTSTYYTTSTGTQTVIATSTATLTTTTVVPVTITTTEVQSTTECSTTTTSSTTTSSSSSTVTPPLGVPRVPARLQSGSSGHRHLGLGSIHEGPRSAQVCPCVARRARSNSCEAWLSLRPPPQNPLFGPACARRGKNRTRIIVTPTGSEPECVIEAGLGTQLGGPAVIPRYPGLPWTVPKLERIPMSRWHFLGVRV